MRMAHLVPSYSYWDGNSTLAFTDEKQYAALT